MNLIKCEFCDVWDSPTLIKNHYKRKHGSDSIKEIQNQQGCATGKSHDSKVNSILEEEVILFKKYKRLARKIYREEKAKDETELRQNSSNYQKLNLAASNKPKNNHSQQKIEPVSDSSTFFSDKNLPLKSAIPPVTRIKLPPFPGDEYKNRKKNNGTVCPLCGTSVENGKILDHKEKYHNERKITPSPSSRRRNPWVSICQGGLPSLGKNSR